MSKLNFPDGNKASACSLTTTVETPSDLHSLAALAIWGILVDTIKSPIWNLRLQRYFLEWRLQEEGDVRENDDAYMLERLSHRSMLRRLVRFHCVVPRIICFETMWGT